MDYRNIKSGSLIAVTGYSDQPYVVKTDDGAWLVCVTVGSGNEGAQGQHVITLRSTDCGNTWTDQVDVSSADMPESSYAVLYKTQYGRIYCFYNYNADNLREVLADDPPYEGGKCTRVDTQGHFVYKYSDDNGKSWSDQYYDIPIRKFNVDLNNPYSGKVMFFWNVGKPLEIESEIFVPLYKVGSFGEGFMRYSEGVLLHCDNINSQKDPAKLEWETLPEGNEGIKCPRNVSIISEEHSFVPLSDGSVFCVFRTTAGHSYCAYSRDKCRSFSQPEPMKYANGRIIKHNRAANFIWKCQNGKYLYWFNNHSGTWYDDRNPVWLSGGIEYMAQDGIRLKFLQPKPVLYDVDPAIGMSYPDLIEDGGMYYITETQKTAARVHKIPTEFIESLWNGDSKENDPGLVITDIMPEIKPFSFKDHNSDTKGSGYNDISFTLSFKYNFTDSSEVIFSTMERSQGIKIFWNAKENRLEMFIGDRQRINLFVDDDELLEKRGVHSVNVIVDGGAGIVYFVTDGFICDGGDRRQFGFSRFDRYFQSINGLKTPKVNKLIELTYYDRLNFYV